MNSRVVVGLVTLLLVALPTYALAHICWIDRVEKALDGLNVYADKRAKYLQAKVKRIGENTTVEQYTIQRGIVKRDAIEIDHLFLQEGDSVFLMQMIEDTCTLKVEAKENRLGVRVESHLSLRGLPRTVTKEFINAEDAPSAK